MAPSKNILPVRCDAGAIRSDAKSRSRGSISKSAGSLLASLVVVASATAASAAQAEPKNKENAGGFVTVRSPITSATMHSVKRQCDGLLNDGARIIVFEIQPGTSPYGTCLELAHYIESIAGAKTKAFVREPLSGHAVMVALAADELVISRKAELGDIGREEKVILPGMEAEYRDLARRRHSRYQAIVLGMLDKKYQVWKVVTARDTLYVLDDELRKLENEEQIKSKEVLIETGQLGNFTGDQLRQLGMAKLTAESRSEVAEWYGMSAKTAIETEQIAVEWRPVLIKIDGEIDSLLKEYVVRHVNEEREAGRNFFIFEIDSLGGKLGPGLELAEFIKDLKGVKTVAYIPRNAISAAAFIALGCDEIIMGPEGKLGDCGALIMDPKGQFHYAPEKLLSFIIPTVETIAKAKGYPPTLARAMIDKDLVVREVRDKRTGRVQFLSEEECAERDPDSMEPGRIVKDKDNFLTVVGPTAVSLDLAKDVVDNVDGLKALYGLEEKHIHVVAPNWVDTLIVILNSHVVSMLLIVGGILGLYTELKIPGAMLPGILAGLCFLLFFWSHVMGGTATALEIVLFLAGVICLGVELLLIPGFGVFGVTGVLLIIFSIILASQTFVFPETTSDWRTFTLGMMPLLAAFASLGGFAYLLSKYLPHVPILGRMILQPNFAAGDDMTATAPSPYEHLLGSDGLAMTMLRPAGLVRFGDQYIDVVSEGTYIEEGARVQVIDVTGNRIVVKQVS
jgi:membrane-bound serine protease (ClpP class)